MRTITFYSYKGGTGRTLAVANTARFLARFGKRVVLLDLDLEAPGLHHKFELTITPEAPCLLGLVDYIHSFMNSESAPDIDPYLIPVAGLPHDSGGSIRLLPAGDAPSPEYSRRLAGIREQELFSVGEGSIPDVLIAVPFFLQLKAQIEKSKDPPDFLLIDSRTGVTELGGIALGLLPDTVVCLVHNNQENFSGAKKILRSVKGIKRPKESGHIEIVVALARIPEGPAAEEKCLLEEVKSYFEIPGDTPDEDLAPLEILPLHSDPRLQIREEIFVGSDKTGNESVLLRDYFKLFRKLRLDTGLAPEEECLVAELAQADQDDAIRPLIVSRRRWEGQNAIELFPMKERLAKRNPQTLKTIKREYFEGPIYGKYIESVLRSLLKNNPAVQGTDSPMPEEIRWDLLAEHISDGVIDFCEDLYYLTENRAALVEIIQLGWCRTFVAYVRSDSQIQKYLCVNDLIEGFEKRMVGLIKSQPSIAVCVLGDTPAASETNRRLGQHLKANNLTSKSNEKDFLKWLEENESGEDRIGICDTVVAKRLDRLTKSAQECPSRNKYSSKVQFKFDRPIPIGIAYPRNDSRWRREIARAIADGLYDLLEGNHWYGFVDEFSIAGLESLSFNQLRQSLLLDLPFEEALAWKRKIDALPKPNREEPPSF